MAPTELESSLASDMRPRLSARSRMHQDKLSGKPALLYPEGVLLLNPTGLAIVELCDGQRTVADIAAHLAERYHAPVDQLFPDVLGYLQRLYNKKLLDVSNVQSLNGASRESNGQDR